MRKFKNVAYLLSGHAKIDRKRKPQINVIDVSPQLLITAQNQIHNEVKKTFNYDYYALLFSSLFQFLIFNIVPRISIIRLV